MKHNNTIEMVNLYIDGELKKEDEAYFFSLISSDEEGREYFKTMNTLSESHRVSEKKYPQTLEDKILKGIPSTKKSISNEKYYLIPRKFVYAFSIILIAFSLFIYAEYNINKEKMKMQVKQTEQQTEMINLIMNSLPQTEVKGVKEKKVIVRANLGVVL
ncbi:MAG: hypothetical protein GY936_04350 [Ignavibacteriae bacterium]|nr:hypothetical protein [Ignavibacteriota bacterium]